MAVNHAAALFDSAIRFHSLLGLPAMIGKPTGERPERKSFLKALDAALDAGMDDAAIMAPLQAALGGEGKARDFLKAHVKEHTRIVNGKVVQVREHDTSSFNHAAIQGRAEALRRGHSSDPSHAAADATKRASDQKSSPGFHEDAAKAHRAAAAYTDTRSPSEGGKSKDSGEHVEANRRAAEHNAIASHHHKEAARLHAVAGNHEEARGQKEQAEVAQQTSEKYHKVADKSEDGLSEEHEKLMDDAVEKTKHAYQTMSDEKGAHKAAAEAHEKAANAMKEHHESLPEGHADKSKYQEAEKYHRDWHGIHSKAAE